MASTSSRPKSARSHLRRQHADDLAEQHLARVFGLRQVYEAALLPQVVQCARRGDAGLAARRVLRSAKRRRRWSGGGSGAVGAAPRGCGASGGRRCGSRGNSPRLFLAWGEQTSAAGVQDWRLPRDAASWRSRSAWPRSPAWPRGALCGGLCRQRAGLALRAPHGQSRTAADQPSRAKAQRNADRDLPGPIGTRPAVAASWPAAIGAAGAGARPCGGGGGRASRPERRGRRLSFGGHAGHSHRFCGNPLLRIQLHYARPRSDNRSEIPAGPSSRLPSPGQQLLILAGRGLRNSSRLASARLQDASRPRPAVPPRCPSSAAH